MVNRIIIENQKPGVEKSIWDAPISRNAEGLTKIEGFATDISVDNGGQIGFKINVNAADGVDVPYKIEIFRLGYYGGAGATLVTTINDTEQAQPDPITDSRGLVDAGNWRLSATWDVPADAVSGVYLAKLTRLDGTGGTNQIPFIVREDGVREDGTKSDIVLQTSDTTWQAYNGWGGNNGELGGNFYGGGVDHPPVDYPNGFSQDRAYAVSYNRPFLTRDGGGAASGAQDYLFGADYAAIYWLEMNGYDVSYISGVDADRLGPDALLGHKAYISVGHDEYWSGGQRANVEAARDGGVNLIFWSGNEVYWKTRYEASIDGADTDYRTLVCYKETWANGPQTPPGAEYYADLDPSSEWTGTWRDLRFAGATDANGDPIATGAEPENSLTGQLFVADGNGQRGAIDIPEQFAQLRFWRNTSVQASGGAFDQWLGILGYEWDESPNDGYRPESLIKLSETTISWGAVLVDEGSTTVPGTPTHNLSLYADPESGALVFGAGTVFWSWGLSNQHDSSPYGGNIENSVIKQVSLNLLAEMGVQPGVADSVLTARGLVRTFASTDATAPTTAIDDLPDTVNALQTLAITGTAFDPDDGVSGTDDGLVAAVEVSLDGGASWRAATGSRDASGVYNWSYTWRPTLADQGHTFQIQARAVDDSLNTDATVASEMVEVTAPVPPDFYTLFDSAAATGQQTRDGSDQLELGVKFQASQAGFITGMRYFRGDGADDEDNDVRPGRLWSITTDAAGNIVSHQQLGSLTFTSAPGENGWQTANFAAPIPIAANTVYVATYHTNDYYISDDTFFTTEWTDAFGVLSAPADADGGGLQGTRGNGLFAIGPAGTFPNVNFNQSNYWVDVIFALSDTPNDPPSITSPDAFSVAENQTAVGVVSASDPDQPLTFSIEGGTDAARFTIDQATGALSFVAAPNFEASTDFDHDNVYDVIVKATDALGAAEQQAVAVTVTDVVETSPTAVNLFGPADTPATIVTFDTTDYELGVRFSASVDGSIVSLRYFRGEVDADDSDTRMLNLWEADGDLLGSISITSDPGETGWQTATFATPIAIQAGEVYVASYGTTQNYAFTSNYFLTAQPGPDGFLTALAGPNNGVFAEGAPGSFPTTSFNNANYWVDVSFAPSDAPNEPPSFVSPAAFSTPENVKAVATVVATDPEDDDLTFSIAGGDDAARFAIDPTTGALAFVSAPDFEAAADVGQNNVYEVTVRVSDGVANVDQQIVVTVDDVESEPAGGFIGRSIQADYIFGETIDALASWAGSTQAALVGGEAGVVEFENLPLPDAIEIGNGAYGLTKIDLAGSTVRIDFPLDASAFPGATFVRFADAADGKPFNGVKITDADGLLPGIRGVSIVEQAGFTTLDGGASKPLTASNLTIFADGDSLFLNVADERGRLIDSDAATPGDQASYVVLSIDFNDAPTAQAGTVDVDEDGSFAGVVAGGDADGDGLTYAPVVGPANGALILNPDGTFTYTPNADFNGTDNFSFVANDGEFTSAPATVSITVAPVNDAPTARDDGFATTFGQAVAGSVLADNGGGPDFDVDTDPLTVTLGTGPVSGILVLNPDGSFTYTPGAGFSGVDSFTYDLSDGVDSTQAMVTITVEPAAGEIWTGGPGTDTRSGTPGPDSYMGAGGADTLSGADGADTIKAGAGDDVLNGGPGADYLSANSGNDTISDGDGLDSLYGGPGADVIALTAGDAALDLVADFSGASGDLVDLSAFGPSLLVGYAGEILTVNGEAVARVRGDFDPLLHIIGGVLANPGENWTGGPGADTHAGGAFNDTFLGEGGADSLRGGGGDDSLRGGTENDTLRGEAGNDSLFGDEGADQFYGGSGVDQLFGGDGADVLRDNLSFSQIDGGAGRDRFRLTDAVGQTLDLTALAPSQFRGVEIVDLLGAGNEIIVDAASVIAASDTDTLQIIGNATNTASLSAEFAFTGVVTLGGATYDRFAAALGPSTAVLLIDSDILLA